MGCTEAAARAKIDCCQRIGQLEAERDAAQSRLDSRKETETEKWELLKAAIEKAEIEYAWKRVEGGFRNPGH